MNRATIDKLATALLYEGYILYPYRPSVKNRQRWTFGGLYPPSWSDAQRTGDASMMQTECLLAGPASAKISVAIRFLQLTDRTIGALPFPQSALLPGVDPDYRETESLEVNGREFQPWQEAVERNVDAGAFEIQSLVDQPCERKFKFPQSRTIEPLPAADGKIAGLIIRRQQAISGEIELSASLVAENLYRLTIKTHNRTLLENAKQATRDDALLRALVSTHTILGSEGCDFVSLTDPPEACKEAAGACQNIGCWPILVGEGTEHDTMLASPIILADYPQLAPESPGDLFDSTEIDEILTLRIMTLTNDEKRTAAATDDRVRDLLVRTESLAREQLANLHGAVRGLRPIEHPQAAAAQGGQP